MVTAQVSIVEVYTVATVVSTSFLFTRNQKHNTRNQKHNLINFPHYVLRTNTNEVISG